MPFVQGRLRGESLSVDVTTQCAHCGRPMHLELDSELNGRFQESEAEPLVFVPTVNFGKLEEPSIVDVF